MNIVELNKIKQFYEEGIPLNNIRAALIKEGYPGRHTGYIGRVALKHGARRPPGWSHQAHNKGKPKGKGKGIETYRRKRSDPA